MPRRVEASPPVRTRARGRSSVGRALASQARCRGFESHRPLFRKALLIGTSDRPQRRVLGGQDSRLERFGSVSRPRVDVVRWRSGSHPSAGCSVERHPSNAVRSGLENHESGRARAALSTVSSADKSVRVDLGRRQLDDLQALGSRSRCPWETVTHLRDRRPNQSWRGVEG